MMKTMKKGLLRTVAFTVAWSILWTTVSNSLFTSVSYAAEAEEENQNLPLEGEVPAAEEAAPIEEETPHQSATPTASPQGEAQEQVVDSQNLPLEGEVSAAEETTPNEETIPAEGTTPHQSAAPTASPQGEAQEQVLATEQTPAEPIVTEESISLTITYKTSEGGSVSVEKEVIEYKKITTTDAEGNATVTTDPETITVKGAKATADEGYEFTAWKSGDKVVSEKATFVPALPKKDVTFTAVFTEKKVEEATPHQSPAETFEPSPKVLTPQGEAKEQETTKGDAQDQESETEDLPLEGKVPAEQADEVEEDTEEDDKVSYPAASFTGETGDVSVRAHVKEGVFPEGTTMKVSAVSASEAIVAAQDMVGEGTEVVDAVAADITFRYEGKEIQPEGGVYVRLSTKRTIAGESHEAITIDGSGSASSMGGASAHSASFDTDHFTVYGVVGTSYEDKDVDQYVRHTYVFYVDDVKVDEIIVHNGDTLTVPADPAGDAKHTFDDWYEIETDASGAPAKDSDGNWKLTDVQVTSADSYGKVGTDETADRTIYVAAKFKEQYTVTLYTNEDQKVIFDTVTGEDEETIALTSPDEAMKAGFPVPAGETLTGWKNVDGEGAQVTADNKIKIDGADIELVPVFADAHTVSFNKVKTLFDDYQVPDQRVLDGEKVTAPDVFKAGSVYRGYRFDGWYDKNPDEYDDAKEFNFDDKLTAESPDAFTLYAKWTPQEVQIKVEIWLENANDTDYTRQETDDTFKVEADGTIPLDEILEKYHDNKYRTPKNPGYFHLNGTKGYEQNPDDTERMLSDNRPAVEISDSKGEVAKYSVADVNGGNYNATANPDGTTVVRINYSRDTYDLKFAFYNIGAIITDANGSQMLNEQGKALARQTGADAGTNLANYVNEGLPTLRVKYGQHLYKRTHDLPDGKGTMFDAYLKTQPWFFEKVGMDTGGQTVFDESNQNYPIRPASDIGDGGELGVKVYTNNDQKKYPIETRFYDEAWTAEDVINGAAGSYTSDGTRTVVYLTDHPHEYTIGASSGGYRLVQITNFGSVQLNKTGDYQALNGQVIANGTHRFKWINGNDRSKECEPIILHYMPVSYTITFKQTRGGTVNGGRLVEADSKLDDIVLKSDTGSESFFYGQDLDIAALMAVDDRFADAGWTTLKDANGVVYSAKDGWKSDVGEEDAFPTKMPAKNLVFYKEWECDSYTVTFDWNRDALPAGTEKVFTDENIPYGDAVKNPAEADKAAASREGFVFLGWKAFERKADGTKGDPISADFYNFNTPVTQNLYIEAQWSPVNGYNVKYLAGDHGKIGADTEKEDPQKYASNAQAPVKYIATPEEGWVFTGWAIGGVVEDGTKLYGSGAVFGYTEAADAADGEKDSIITLVAQYDKVPRTTTVTYHSNYPAGGSDVEPVTLNDYVINGTFTVKAANDGELSFQVPYTAPDGNQYRFLGWTNNAENSKVYADLAAAREALDVFRAGETAAAGEKDNDLYALWQVIVNDTPGTDPDPDPDDPTPTPDDPTDIPDDPTPTTDTPAPEPVNPVVSLLENILGVRRTPPTGDDVPAVAGERRSRVDTNDYSRMEYWMILALGCVLIQADMLRKVRVQKRKR